MASLKEFIFGIKNKNILHKIMFETDFSSQKFIKIKIKDNEKFISIDELTNYDYGYLMNSDIFSISENRQELILEYENIEKMDNEELSFFKLPNYYNGFIYIENSGNFLNINGMKYEYHFYDSENNEYRILCKNLIRGNNGKRAFLNKEQYNLINQINKFNNEKEINTMPEKQYELLEKIKESSKIVNIIMGNTLKNEDEIETTDKIQIDFLEKTDKEHLEILPKIEEISEEENRKFQDEFRKHEKVKNFYQIENNGVKKKIVLNKEIKENLKIIKDEKSEISYENFLNKNSKIFNEIESENIEILFGPRVKGIGFINYRPVFNFSNNCAVGWFYQDFPKLFTDEEPIQLYPQHLEYLKKCLENTTKENILLELDTEDGIKKLMIKPEYLKDEILKLEYSILEYKDVKNAKDIIEVSDEFIENPDIDFVHHKGKYIKNPFDIDNIIKCKEFAGKKLEEEINSKKIGIVLKDNIENIEYEESNIQIKNDFEVEIPISLKPNITLYEYQKEGLKKMQGLYKTSKLNGLLLCDDMGLGKTIQILSFLAWLKEKNELKPSLVIVPTSLISNWDNDNNDERKQGEIQKFFNQNTFSVKRICGKISKTELDEISKTDIIIGSYETIRINSNNFGEIKWNVVICDEAQKIKNPKAYVTTVIKSLNAEFKIACTATPIENILEDLWTIADFVKPGLMGSLKEFKKKYSEKIKKYSDDIELVQRINDEIKSTLDEFYLRRTKQDELGENFPKKIILYEKIKPSDRQQDVLKELLLLRAKYEAKLVLIQRMIMACSHPRIVDEVEKNYIEESLLVEEAFKLFRVIERLKYIGKQNEKVIIFTKYKKMQDILWRIIKKEFGITANIINGEVDTDIRKMRIDNFRLKEGFNILILSPEAGGVGLNIVEANHVIHYTRHWNPAKEEQATDRAYRIGQKKDVYVYYPVVSYDVEESETQTFKNDMEWIDEHINDDVRKKSPEEKLNKIVIKKKKMLKDFFLATSFEEDIDLKEFFSEETEEDSRYITINNLKYIGEEDFINIAKILHEKEYGAKGYNINTLNITESKILSIGEINSMIGCRNNLKIELMDEIINKILSEKTNYEKILGIRIEKVVIYTQQNFSYNLNKEKTDIEIINKERLTDLLEKFNIDFEAIRCNEKKYSIQELKEELNNINS